MKKHLELTFKMKLLKSDIANPQEVDDLLNGNWRAAVFDYVETYGPFWENLPELVDVEEIE